MVSEASGVTNVELWIYLLFFGIILHTSSCQSVEEYQKPRIHHLHVQSDIKYRFATTLVTSKVVNPSNVSKETTFDVILPNEAFISDFIMEIDGRIYPGQVDEKEKAIKQYEKAKQKRQHAGKDKKRPRETNRFRVDVNIGAMSRVTFNLTYQELLHRRTGSYQHVIYIQPGQIVDDFRIDVSILESRDITNLVVSPLRNDTLPSDRNKSARNKLARIKRPTSKSARIRYHPSVKEQSAHSQHGINALFTVEYEIESRLDAGDVLVLDGYFVHFFSPRGLEPIPKDILFILDVSTSMVGPKIKQLKEAMRKILNDLDESDNFNIVQFSTGARFWKSGVVVPTTRDNIAEAKAYLGKIKASGWTNINEALTFGVDFLSGLDETEGRSPIAVFLTDGKASTGEQNIDNILQNVKLSNTKQIPVFGLAFGKGADYDFVNKVTVQNFGVGRKIYEDTDAALQIKGFFDEISTPTLMNVKFKYLSGSTDAKNVTKSNFDSFYDGSELIAAGKIDENKINVLSLAVSGTGVQGQIELSMTTGLSDQSDLIKTRDHIQITENVWAYMTIKQLLQQAVGEPNPVKQDELRRKALDFSLKYKLITPLTSMVITKPDGRDVIELEDGEELSGEILPIKQNGTGSDSYQGGGGGDPHFMIRVKGIQHPLCFDIDGKPGQNIRLLKDPRRGITINAGIIRSTSIHTDRRGFEKTFMGDVVVITKRFTLSVNTTHIFLNGVHHSWDTEVPPGDRGTSFYIVRKDPIHRLLYIDLGQNIRVVIKRVEHQMAHYLNVYLDKGKGLSRKAGGIIGQFVHKNIKMVKIHKNNKGKVIGNIKVSEKGVTNKIKTNLVSKPDILTGKHELCWSAHRSVKGLLDGEISDYFLKSVYSP